VVVRDSSVTLPPLVNLGRFSITDPPAVVISKADRRHVRYTNLSELLERSLLLPRLSHGGFGGYDAPSMFGGEQRDLTVYQDGRPLVDPWAGGPALSSLAPEGANSHDIVTGTDAVGLAPTSTLTAVNMPTSIHNTAVPYSSLWYAQGGGGLIAADVTLSQNVAPNLNVTVGLRRNGAIGIYDRTDFDVWNGRVAMRAILIAQTHLAIRYDVTSHNSDQWGGLRQDVPLFSTTEVSAQPRYQTLRDETRRHDLSAMVTHVFDADTTVVFTAQVYGTSLALLRLRDSTTATNQEDGSSYVVRSRNYGGITRLEFSLGPVRLAAGATSDILTSDRFVEADRANEDVTTALFAHGRLALDSTLTLRAAARTDVRWGKVLTGFGSALRWAPSRSVDVDIDVATAQRAPTLAEGRDLDPERHLLMSVTARLEGFRLLAYRRTVASTILANDIVDQFGTAVSTKSITAGERTTTSVGLSYKTTIGDITIEPLLRLTETTQDGVTDERLPAVAGRLDVSYRYAIGNNSVQLGIVGAMMSPLRSRTWSPISWQYTSTTLRQNAIVNGLDLYLAAVLGNATVRVGYENVFAQRQYTVAMYPDIVRNISVVLHWTFLD